jgi:hypothetical protein
LRRLEALEERRRETLQSIHAHCFHTSLFFLAVRNAVMNRSGSKPSGATFTRPPRSRRALRSHL